jgi:hypothetical protein
MKAMLGERHVRKFQLCWESFVPKLNESRSQEMFFFVNF